MAVTNGPPNVRRDATNLLALELSCVPRDERHALMAAYTKEVYCPAFPDVSIREDTDYWLSLLDAEHPDPPQPLIEVILLVDGDNVPVAGVTIEHYRTAGVGLLTYIAVAETMRGAGIGRRLVGAARAWLDRAAGPDTPMLAETERYQDACDDAEREATDIRQKRLARLGARMIDMDYVMPPLRQGELPHRLHLMCFQSIDDQRTTLSAPQISSFLKELAAALGADLAAHADTAEMIASLATMSTLSLHTLPRAIEVFGECAVFSDIADFAFTFLFELPANGNDGSRPTAFRLESIHRAIAPHAQPGEPDERRAIYDALVEPVRSYLDDVTNGGPGRGGRPLIVLAQPEAIENDNRSITLHCPARWRYRAEGRTVEMQSANGEAKLIELGFRDSFCLFESGRLFYCVSLFPSAEGQGKGVDEYVLIAMQRLAMKNPASEFVDAWRFALAGKEPCSLTEMAQQRLTALANDLSETPNAIRDFLVKTLGLKADFQISPCAVRNLLILVEDKRLQKIAALADDFGEGFALSDAVRDVAEKIAGARANCVATTRPHYPSEEPDELLPFLALAGILQSVCDFPFQDPSEIHDSTQPAVNSDGCFHYAHPRFQIELNEDSRSMHNARFGLGNCPYLTLMWLVVVHDELMVTETEEAIDILIYGDDESALIAEPMGPLARAVDAISLPWRSPVGDLRRNLEARFELFRRYSINQSSHLFRYKKEREALAAVEAGIGNRDRYDRAHAMIDRIEGLVEDIHAVNGAYGSARTGRVLMFITLLGLINFYDQLTGSLSHMLGMDTVRWVAFLLLLLALFILSFPSELINLPRRISRSAAKRLRQGR